MAIVSRHYWKPTDIDKFVKCHREFHDNHLKNAGAVDMKLYKHDSKDIYIADVIFDSWSGKDQWEEYFKTNTSSIHFIKFNKLVIKPPLRESSAEKIIMINEKISKTFKKSINSKFI